MASGWNLWVWLECIGVVSGCCCKEVYRYPHNNYYFSLLHLYYIAVVMFKSVTLASTEFGVEYRRLRHVRFQRDSGQHRVQSQHIDLRRSTHRSSIFEG